jgi:hypothetical protein
MRSDRPALLLAVASLLAAGEPKESPELPKFTFFHEFYGSGGYNDPQVKLNLQQGMMNGIALWPPVGPAAARAVNGAGGLMLRLAGAPGPARASEEDIDNQSASFASVALTAPGSILFWNLLPEWDQSGGWWVPNGRPSYAGLERREAHARFLDYYAMAYPRLMHRLSEAATDERSYRLTAITDYSPNVFFGYELGAELQMLERGIDELGDLSTGIAYIRGAATQFAKPWGIDISTWRASTNGATNYDVSGRLRSGWSAGYLERLYYLSFAAGAQFIHNEAATYRFPSGTLNPFGEVTNAFADFALRRHPDIGQPTVNVALLVDHFNGLDPRHGPHNQASAVWYQDIPYSSGDYMVDNLFQLAFPGFWLHGLAPGAPFANGQGVPEGDGFERFLAQGGDPRPYEPMPKTRWGDSIDVITNHAASERFDKYKVIVLAGDVALDNGLVERLSQWVAQGGILVANVAQVDDVSQEFAGVQVISRLARPAFQSRWISSLATQSEAAFSYLRVRPLLAKVLAVTAGGDPLVTSRAFGDGEIILTTPLYLQANTRDRLLEIGVQLLDRLVERFEPVKISGKAIEYIVGRPANKLVTTLANHDGSPWEGEITAPAPDGTFRVMDYKSDEPMVFLASDGKVTVPVKVPPYSVRVVAIEKVE